MYYCIVNPYARSGLGLQEWLSFKALMEEHNIKYQAVMSNEAGDATRLTYKLTSSRCLIEDMVHLVVFGGDGTMNEVINGISDFDKTALGYIPAGSAGDLALGLGIRGTDSKVLGERILEGQIRRTTDIGKVTAERILDTFPLGQDKPESFSRLFCVSAGIGFDAVVCKEASVTAAKKLLNKLGLGKLTYLSVALKEIFKANKFSADIRPDDKGLMDVKDILLLAAMITPYEGGGFKFCPEADYCDSLLDICLAASMSKASILKALPLSKFGKHGNTKGISFIKCKKLLVDSRDSFWVHTDGEVSVKAGRITFENTDLKLKLLF